MFDQKSRNIFRAFRGFFGEMNTFGLKYSRNIFKFYGGDVVSDLNSLETGHGKILYFCDLENFEKLDSDKKCVYVNHKWILDCKSNHTIVNIKEYEI